ncbi:unnamed protein product, partial [Mesorhabditis spiculigera]
MIMYYYSKDFQRLYLLPMFCNATNDGDSLYSMFIYTITLFEFGIHFISLAGYIPFIKIVHESRLFHPNLRKFIVFFALLLQLNFPTRTILLFYEFEVVSVTGRLAQDWLLLLPCTLRYFLACVSTLSFFVIINERIAATYFIKDYEQHKRSWIFGIIMFSFLILGTTVCPLIGFYVSGARLIVFLCFFLVPLSIFMVGWQTLAYYCLLKHNNKLLKELSRDLRPGKRGYHLSMRYQVSENLRALEMVKKIVFCLAISGISNGGLAIFHFIIFDERFPFIGCWMEVATALYVLFFLLTSLWAVDEWRQKFVDIMFPILGPGKRSETNSLSAPSTDIQAETNAYFQYYSNAW